MTDEFNKGFRRGYDAALQDLNVFLELTGSIRDRTKEQDSNDTLSFLLTHPYGTEEETGVQEPLKSYAESHQRGHTCSQCSCWGKYVKTIFCIRAHRRVLDCDTACDQFEPNTKEEY